MASSKRQRVDVDAAQEVLAELCTVYSSMPEELLWDTSMRQTLIQPTACFGIESSKEYAYIGRARARALLQEMQDLGPGRSLQVQGAKGSGKSTAVCALVGYMLGKLQRSVVYICAPRFIESPVEVARHALLVATRCDESVARLTEFEQLVQWCSRHRKDRLLFVVDDWDCFDAHPTGRAMLLELVAYYHILVKLSSASSRERTIFAATDKPLPTFDFDGPYTRDELETWIGHSTLPPARLEALDRLTGGMPRLVRFYEEVGGDEELYIDRIEEPYASKLLEKMIQLQTTKSELAAAVVMVTTGVKGGYLKQPVDLTCFYKEGKIFKLLSPYLRSRAEYSIMKQAKELQSGLGYTAILTWAGAVRMDCLRVGRNPARAGWNVEGLVIAVMRHEGRMWPGLSFERCKTYERGGEAALLGSLMEGELLDGVLLVPIAFSERAVDVIYLKLDSKGVLTIKVVRITVSKWKNKRRKESHKVWQEEILPRWLSERWSVEHQFIYVMPEKMDKDQLQYIDRDLCSYVRDCHAQVGADGDAAELTEVTSQPTAFKVLGDVHAYLSEFDRLLDLGDACGAGEETSSAVCCR